MFEMKSELLRTADERSTDEEYPTTGRFASDTLAFSFLQPSEQSGYLDCLAIYYIVETIGRGGMGVVFEGFDPVLEREMAIKTLQSSSLSTPHDRDRFVIEARATPSLQHDNIVTIHWVDESDQFSFLVMEYIKRMSLADDVTASGLLSVEEAVRIGQQAADSLVQTHHQVFVHRDIKARNILVEEHSGRVKVTDFGLACSEEDPPLTQSGNVAGKPYYMLPE